MGQSEAAYWVGVDWGHEEHVVCVLDAQGTPVLRFRVVHCPEGLQELVRRLREYEPVEGIAVESTRSVLIDALLQANFAVYPINPKLSSKWRKAWSVSGAKDDGRDALVLAHALIHQRQWLAPLKPDSESARELALLCEDEARFIGMQTCMVQQLKDTLRQYYPAALGWFKDWTSQSAWDFVLSFPTPESIATASKKKVYGFLRSHRIGLSAKRREMVEARGSATEWPSDRAATTAKSLLAVSLAKQLRALAPTLKEYRRRIEEQFEAHEDKEVFESLPGAARKLAPRLACALGTDRTRFDSARSVQQLSGTAPVTSQSGKRKEVRMRRACQKDFRCALHLFALQTLQRSRWSRAYYDLARARGQSHALALRNLANKWLKILYRMWQNRETYDEQRYIRQLVKKNSPVAYQLGLLKTRG